MRGDKPLYKWRYYPGAFFLLVNKFLILIFGVLIALFGCIFFLDKVIGKDEVKPYTGFQLWLIKALMKIYSKIDLFVAGIKLKHVYQKYDYSYYLGPDYEETQKKYKHASTIVANHTNMHD